MTRIAIAALSAIAAAFAAGVLFGAWCDARGYIEWED